MDKAKVDKLRFRAQLHEAFAPRFRLGGSQTARGFR
jgi:hypothetical protein